MFFVLRHQLCVGGVGFETAPVHVISALNANTDDGDFGRLGRLVARGTGGALGFAAPHDHPVPARQRFAFLRGEAP